MTTERRWLHLGLLGLTFVSVAWTQGQLSGTSPDWWFAGALLLILGSHEMGHYVFAQHHGVRSSLPYFIPAPYLGFGTLGAVIRIRSRIPDRNALVDIGASGPLAGLLAALPILWMGLSRSHWVALPSGVDASQTHQSLIDLIRGLLSSHGHVFADSGGNVVALYGDNLLLKLMERLICGVAPPGQELAAHPFVMAGWFGTLVTTLNLIPVGQLDGGHLTHALFGRRAVWIGRAAALGILGLTVFASVTWVPWLVVTSWVVGFRHPPETDAQTPVSLGRRWICVACLASFVLCFLPIPVSLLPVP